MIRKVADEMDIRKWLRMLLLSVAMYAGISTVFAIAVRLYESTGRSIDDSWSPPVLAAIVVASLWCAVAVDRRYLRDQGE